MRREISKRVALPFYKNEIVDKYILRWLEGSPIPTTKLIKQALVAYFTSQNIRNQNDFIAEVVDKLITDLVGGQND